jgi:hypothetical protein
MRMFQLGIFSTVTQALVAGCEDNGLAI